MMNDVEYFFMCLLAFYMSVFVKMSIHVFFVHLFVDGHLGFFHRVAVVDIAAINMGVQMPLWITTFVSLG